jgi:hypothetical protein
MRGAVAARTRFRVHGADPIRLAAPLSRRIDVAEVMGFAPGQLSFSLCTTHK